MNNSLGIYVHVPFCLSKCAYCDFYSLECIDAKGGEYVDKIVSEINRWGGVLNNPPADTLYFGGGTPSLLKSSQIKAIIDSVRYSFSLERAEITLEVNPGDELSDFFAEVKKAGVNRISVGMQSANDNELKYLSRRHSALQVKKTVTAARAAGINNISLDIMLGIPGQTKESLKQTVQFALSLDPQHISAYLLSLEPKTPLYKNKEKYVFPNDDEAGELYLYTCELLKKAGYNRYEISNFAKSGYESRHNSKYWQGADYLGLGPAAHSFINGKRFYYKRDINKYLASPTEVFDGEGGDAAETLMLRLRLSSGLNIKDFANKFKLTDIKINRLIKKAELLNKNDLVRLDGMVISLTDKGALLSNAVIGEFLNCLG